MMKYMVHDKIYAIKPISTHKHKWDLINLYKYLIYKIYKYTISM